ncbi:peptidoglycan bridge formation glycyltransferase FemA/FemB family protein [Kribbella sp. NPDC048915]|uniref:lipid II:glycine glycyltransferase FemX n=1 Tax=Kribbella sp. NPDC048915 TaxID=3155148 RepID=UPI0034021DF2
MTISVIEPPEYEAASDLYGGRSFLQVASWAAVKTDWASELLAWRDAENRVVGTALVLLRRLPAMSRWYAYLPEGPDIDWADPVLERWLAPLIAHLERHDVFAVRMGPPPLLRRWRSETLAAGVGRRRRIDQVLPDLVEPVGAAVAERLRTLGWTRAGEAGMQGDAQPRYLFQVPLAGRDAETLKSGLSKQWQRNIRKAVRSGVEVRRGAAGDLAAFFELLRTTERRNGFRLGRTLAYYERQFRALNEAAPGRMRLYLSTYGGEILAAHTMTVVGRRVWYQTGASADHRRDVRPSHILQWTMMRDALELGASWYDMRGVANCLDPEDPAYGLLRWKLGTGGEVAQTTGEWERALPGPINRALHRALIRHRARR